MVNKRVMNVLLIVFLIVFLAFFTISSVYIYRKISLYEQILRSFFIPESNDKPAVAWIILDKAADIFLSKLKTSALGSLSGTKRAEQAVQAELMQVENPILGLLSQFNPKIAKLAVKHPQIADWLQSKFGGGPGGGPGPVETTEKHNNNGKYQFTGTIH